ncbi:hypothetical protein Hdeb2414_s0002g00064231 [Helianthus debilis subsp. tardiflorus]
MHLNHLSRVPTPIFFGGWVYRLFKHFTRIPRSFERSPWSGRVDYHICRAMNLLYEAEDGSMSFQMMQGHAWNPQEALVLHAPPPHYQYQPHGDPGQSSSQGGGFPNLKVYMIFCRKTSCAPGTPTTLPTTHTTGSELSNETSTIYKTTSAASGSIWRVMGMEVMTAMRTWTRGLQEQERVDGEPTG